MRNLRIQVCTVDRTTVVAVLLSTAPDDQEPRKLVFSRASKYRSKQDHVVGISISKRFIVLQKYLR